MTFKFSKAVRRAVPMLISISSVSGGGKTYSALLMAAGIAGPNGRVGFIDTENGRGSMYVDSPGIMRALPNSYEIAQLDPPFSPENYIEAITAAEKSGVNVLIIDSATHEWEGIGGCQEIAENNKLKGMPNWSKAKMAHKRFMNHCLSSSMHIIFCLRAREKVKMVKKGTPLYIDPLTAQPGPEADRDTILPMGIQPICEKNFVFEMLLSLQLDERSHFAVPLKVPEPLAPLFTGARLITKEDGERIRAWNESGAAVNPIEFLQKRARAAAEEGLAEYQAFFQGLDARQKKIISDTTHAENKDIASRADHDRKMADAGEKSDADESAA